MLRWPYGRWPHDDQTPENNSTDVQTDNDDQLLKLNYSVTNNNKQYQHDDNTDKQ